MKRFSLVSVAFAMTLALVPYVLADSFGSIANSSRASLYPGFNAGASGFVHAAITTPFDSDKQNRGKLDASFSRLDGAIAIDSSLSAIGSAPLIRKSGAGLSGIGSRRAVAFYANGASTGDDGRFYSSDKENSKAANDASRANNIAGSGSDPSTATPEPGSLFLLGTGLLGLALILFWKSAGRPTGPR